MLSLSDLRQRWQRESATCGWLDPADWWTPAVDAVVDALAERRDATHAARELGHERATEGIELDQARGDLEVATSIADLCAVERLMVLDGLTVAWIVERLRIERSSACTDPLTGLATPIYLAARLGEVVAEIAGTAVLTESSAASRAWVLVGVRIEPCVDPWQREACMIIVQRSLTSAFRSGQTVARTGPWTAVALIRCESEELADGLSILGLELGECKAARQLPQVRQWVEPVPGSSVGVEALLGLLAL